jgi:His-Xaa-Ser system radical SAM maturase HxsC
MISLRGRATSTTLTGPLQRSLWLVTSSHLPNHDRNSAAYMFAGDEDPPEGALLHLVKHGATRASIPNCIELPTELDHVSPGDVLSVSPDGQRLAVLWRRSALQNSVLLTEQCDNYCLMCSQPPKEIDDRWLLQRAFGLVGLLPPDTGGIIFTGGEPTLYGAEFLELLALCATQLPIAEVHILSNGRRFADAEFVASYAAIDNPRMMVGIPIYGAESSLHDFVVQSRGAFDETVRGIMQLAQLGQRVEIRVVAHKQTAPALVEIAEFIARNLPFVEQVALMGLEMMGLARANLLDVWIDPYDYREALTEATLSLAGSGVKTMIYNHPLCLLDQRVWPFAMKSISDWKNEYADECRSCSVLDECGGFFHSAKYKSSSHIRPIASSHVC